MTEGRQEEGPRDPGAELPQVLAHLEEKARHGRRLDRYDARWLLLELGALLRAGGEAAARPWIERVRGALSGRREEWERAAGEELALAAAEHVHSVDPRYLSRPDYDVAYTLAARERLESRLVAAAGLGIALAPAAREAVLRADRLLAQAGHPLPGQDLDPGTPG